jgi:hypothetical protein
MERKEANRLATKLFKAYKRSYHFFNQFKVRHQKVLFILGCQRSGTTLFTRIFEKDINTKVYGEFSVISDKDPQKIRLNPISEIKKEFGKQKVAFIVTKPIVESQNTKDLLDAIPDSRAFWITRDYRDVVSSNLIKFGERNGIADLKKILFGGQNWRNEKLSDTTHEILEKHYVNDMDPRDATALFWYSRNILFFEQEMDKDPRVLLGAYNDLGCSPKRTIEALYHFCQQPFPGKRIIKEVHGTSIGKGSGVTLSPDIEKLCQDLMDGFMVHYNSREIQKHYREPAEPQSPTEPRSPN